jgi:putative IMPACT (imprinted ancient) family translation regulator
VSDVVAVVTRWFGGTLLGAGGLVRAYGDAVRAGLDAAGVHERVLAALFDVPVSHADAGRLESDLRARGVDVRDATYAERVTLHVGVTPDTDLAALLAELTGGGPPPHVVGPVWVDA